MSETPFSTHTPRYQQVAAVLQRNIQAALYPVGSLLPPEPELCKQFGVSRHTVREAVRSLCELGLVSRHQGIGTRIRSSQAKTSYVASIASLRDLMEYTQQTRLKYLGCKWIMADAKLAELLRCEGGERWLELNTFRLAADGGDPVVHMRVFVRPECDGIQNDIEEGDAWIYGLIEKHGGERIHEAQQVIGATAIPAASAKVLGVKAGLPGLLVRRYYLGRNARLLSVSLNVYPAGRFEFSTRWRLEGANAPDGH